MSGVLSQLNDTREVVEVLHREISAVPVIQSIWDCIIALLMDDHHKKPLTRPFFFLAAAIAHSGLTASGFYDKQNMKFLSLSIACCKPYALDIHGLWKKLTTALCSHRTRLAPYFWTFLCAI